MIFPTSLFFLIIIILFCNFFIFFNSYLTFCAGKCCKALLFDSSMCITKYLFLQGNIIKFFDRNPLLTLPAFHPWSFIMPRDAASVPSLVVDRNLTDDASCRPLDWQWFRDADFLWQNWKKFGKCDLETILYRTIRTCQPQQNFHFMPPFNILKIHSHKIFILHFSIVGVFVHVKTFYVFTI